MNNIDNITEMAISKEVASNIVTDLRGNKEDVETRDGQMTIFNDYRKGLPSSRKDWGTKVFFGACISLNILEKIGTKYRPTKDTQKAFPNMFIEINNDWGIADEMAFTMELFPIIAMKAEKLREVFKKQQEIRTQALKAIRDANEAMSKAIGGV